MIKRMSQNTKTQICAKCGEVIYEGDIYCRFCGNKAEEKKYGVNWRMISVLYGPPIKRKFRCRHCGHMWVSQFLGGERANHCPSCGKNVDVIDEIELEMWIDYGPMEDPFDEKHRPLIFTEEEVEQLFKQRKFNSVKDHEYGFADGRVDYDEKAILALQRIGKHPKEEFDSKAFPRTEKDADEILLASDILKIKGDMVSEHAPQCPNCKNRISAVINYAVLDGNYKKVIDNLRAPHMVASPFLLNDYVLYKDLKSEISPAYKCLCCGTKYGSFVAPEYLNEHRSMDY